MVMGIVKPTYPAPEENIIIENNLVYCKYSFCSSKVITSGIQEIRELMHIIFPALIRST